MSIFSRLFGERPTGLTAEESLVRASNYLQHGKFGRAIAEYTEAIRLKPSYAEAYYFRGAAYVGKGNADQAIADYTEAIRLNPNLAGAYCCRGVAYVEKRDFDSAIADCTVAIELNPKKAEAYYCRGVAYGCGRGDFNRAIADHTEAIRLNPRYAEAYCGRAAAYLQQGEFDRVIADYTEAIRLAPNLAEAYYGRGTAYMAKGDPNKAKLGFDQAKRLGFKPPVGDDDEPIGKRMQRLSAEPNGQFKESDTLEKLPANWKEILRECNFFTARRLCAEFLRSLAAEAAAEGGYYSFKSEFVRGWERFAADPCYETAVQWIEGDREFSPVMFTGYFEESCPGGMRHRHPIGTASTFPVTEYRIGTRIETVQGLRRLSIVEERSLFNSKSASLCFRPVGELAKKDRGVIPHRLDGEVLYYAPPIHLLDYARPPKASHGENNTVLVGAVNGVIEKIAASLDLDASDDLREVVRRVFEYCEDLLGTPTRETKEENLFQWEKSDGTVTLVLAGFRHPGNNTDTPGVHLVITSKSYR